MRAVEQLNKKLKVYNLINDEGFTEEYVLNLLKEYPDAVYFTIYDTKTSDSIDSLLEIIKYSDKLDGVRILYFEKDGLYYYVLDVKHYSIK